MTSIQAADSPNVRLVTATEQCCKAEELPDETLDSIIQYVGAPFTVTPVSLPSAATGHASLHPCAMVCRRWYRITTPYLFRVVAITDNSPGDASELCALLSRKPSLMRYIQAATIDQEPLPLNVLAPLLDLLPHLHYLQILGVSDVCTGNKVLLRGSHSLKRLTFGGLQSGSESEDFDRDVLKLLQLFQEIDELVLYEDSRDPIQLDLNMAQLKTGEPRIHAIDVHDCIHDTAPYLTCLHEHGALRSITCLTLDCDSPYKLEAINQWLLCAGATLGELYLSLDFSGNDQEIADPTNNESAVDLRSYVVVTLGSGIGACVALHGFRLEMCSSYQPWVDNRFPPDIITQIAVNDWLLCLTLLSLMVSADSRPHGGQLRHLSFAYHSHSWEHDGEGYEVLPWERMRSLLRRFHNLESVSMKFSHTHEKNISRAVTEEAHTLPTFEEQTQKELASFKDILVCNDEELFLLCTQDFCRWQVPQHAHWKDLATEL